VIINRNLNRSPKYLRVCSVIAGTHRQKDDVLARGLLQGQSDGDGSALSRQVRFDAVNHLRGSSSGHVVGVVHVRHPAATAAVQGSIQFVGRAVLLPLLVDVVLKRKCRFENSNKVRICTSMISRATKLTRTTFSTISGVWLGTIRMENLPMTFLGMTVLAPGSLKAP